MWLLMVEVEGSAALTDEAEVVAEAKTLSPARMDPANRVNRPASQARTGAQDMLTIHLQIVVGPIAQWA